MTDMSVDVTYLFSESGLTSHESTVPGLGVTVAADSGPVQVKGTTVVIHDCNDVEEAYERAVHEMYNSNPDFQFPVRAQVIGTNLTEEAE